MDGETFIVYAIDTPTYPSLMFGGSYAMRYHRPSCCPVPGSTIALSGGLCRETSGGRVEMIGSGLVQVAMDEMGKRFGELAVAALVESDDPVTVVIDAGGEAARTKWASKAQDAGFRTVEAGEAVVCLGVGSDLPRLRWLETACATSDTSLFVGRGAPSPLQQSIERRVTFGESGIDLARRVWEFPRTAPGLISEKISGCRLVAGLGGLEHQDLFINRNDTDVTGVRDSLKAIARELGLALYCAGSTMDLEAADWFEAGEDWRPLSDAWVREA